MPSNKNDKHSAETEYFNKRPKTNFAKQMKIYTSCNYIVGDQTHNRWAQFHGDINDLILVYFGDRLLQTPLRLKNPWRQRHTFRWHSALASEHGRPPGEHGSSRSAPDTTGNNTPV